MSDLKQTTPIWCVQNPIAAAALIGEMLAAMRGMIAEADRNTDPFIRARAIIAEVERAK